MLCKTLVAYCLRLDSLETDPETKIYVNVF